LFLSSLRVSEFPRLNPHPETSMNSSRLILVTGVFCVALTACHRPASAPPQMLPSVTVVQPLRAAVTNWDEYPSHLEAVESVEIRSRVSGYLESIHFEDGAEVKTGDLLFVIDPKPFQAALDRAQAERRRAETQLELSRNDLRRGESLRGTKAISDEEFDARSKAVRSAEDSLIADKAAEASATLDLGYTRITAPIGGKIGRRLVTAGNLIQGSGMMPGTLLATLVRMDPIYCYFDADEKSFLQYRKSGMCSGKSDQQEVPRSCEVGLAGEEGFPHKGRLDFFDNQVNRASGTIRLRAILGNSDRALVPGGFARVRLPVDRIESALLIPEAAIASEQTRKFVYVINAEQVADVRPIQLGRLQGTQRVVLSGLKPEDRVAVTGLMMLRPGVKVQITDPNAPARPAGPMARQ
jgi:RND family efflux transporter MFP subunit